MVKCCYAVPYMLLLAVVYADRHKLSLNTMYHYAECRYAECNYAECQCALPRSSVEEKKSFFLTFYFRQKRLLKIVSCRRLKIYKLLKNNLLNKFSDVRLYWLVI